MTKVLRLISFFLVALTLAACGGGGGSSAPQGQGNTQISVTNTSGSDISRATVTLLSTNQLISDQSFICANGGECAFMSDIDGPVEIVLYQSNGDPVAAYYNYQPTAGLIRFKTSRVMLGIYLFKKIDDQVPDVTTVIANKLANYFTLNPSPDGTPDFYQELGQFYKTSVVLGGMSASDFYAKIIAETNDGKVLPASSVVYALSHVVYDPVLAFAERHFTVRDAYAANACSVISNVFTFAGSGVGVAAGWKEYVWAKALSPALDGISSLIGSNCSNGSEDIAATLQKITEQLNVIQAQLNALDIELKEFWAYSANQDITRLESQLTGYADKLDLVYATYDATLGFGKYNNLRDYVKANGGLEKALNGGVFSKPSANLQKLLSCKSNCAVSLDQQWLAFKGMTETAQFNSLRDALLNACKSTGAEDEDVFQKRTSCNARILKLIGQYTGSLQRAVLVLKDEYETLDYYAKNGSSGDKAYLANQSGAYKGVDTYVPREYLTDPKNWTAILDFQIYKMIDPATNALKLITVGPDQNGLYDPIKEIRTSHSTLLSNLSRICGIAGTDKSNIIGLYPNANKPFLVATCESSDFTNRYVTSRHFYNDDSDDVAKVLGALVPKSMVDSIADNKSITGGVLFTDSSTTWHGLEFKPFYWRLDEGYFDVYMDADSGEAPLRSDFDSGRRYQNFSISKRDGDDHLILPPAYSHTSYSWIKYTEVDKIRPSSSETVKECSNMDKKGTWEGGAEWNKKCKNVPLISFVYKLKINKTSDITGNVHMLCVSSGCSLQDPRHSGGYNYYKETINFYNPQKTDTKITYNVSNYVEFQSKRYVKSTGQ